MWIQCIDVLFLFFSPCKQEQVSGSTTSTVLHNLDPNTVYKVTLLPIYEQGVEGKRQFENGKTSRSTYVVLGLHQSLSVAVLDGPFLHHMNSCSPVFCTEPLGAVKNIQVTNPTVNSLRVHWDPADGDVRQYNILYVPTAGGTEGMVCIHSIHVVKIY